MTPDDIADQLAALRGAGARLKRRPYREVLEALGAVLEGWRNPDSAWRRELVERLPAATGFTAPLVREGLQRALDGWTSAALRELVRRELGSAEDLDASSSRSAIGFDVTAVWLAGSIPMPSLLALIAPLAVRSPVLAKAASRDPVTPSLVARSVEETDAELGRCIRIASFPAQRVDLTDALLQADCICATGSDEAIAALRARVAPVRRFVADGHRFSVAAVAPPGGAQRRVELAQRLAVDVALWDQLGCLSPIEVFAVDPDVSHASALGEALADSLAHAEKIWPRGDIDAHAAHAIAQQRAEAELRCAAGRRVSVYRSDSTAWTVIVEGAPAQRAAPLHRFVRVVPVQDVEQLLDALRPRGAQLAAVAIEGFGAQTQRVAHALARLGASRICAPGALQSPPLDWRHAGRGVLAPLARFSDLEVLA